MECQPYSEQACRDAATALRLQLGTSNKAFVTSYRTRDGEIRGCFVTKSGVAFYSSGGTERDMQQALPNGMYRPTGYDCAGKHKVCMHAYVGMYVYYDNH